MTSKATVILVDLTDPKKIGPAYAGPYFLLEGMPVT